ncbi:hypothetical protein JMN32_24025 [Fulvivirga sp. 29W222]|uniref:PH domain-containing protein n=1 Tax=Fulvivirga marina TaxID=2494733 RepID=A0A937KDR5_9BACT|nr:hypothetical protein [Fulvivirga marina]MBL6449401.1 hypothetical protein [Fulvivirga marina]
MVQIKRPLSSIILLTIFIGLLVYQAFDRSGGIYYFYFGFIALLAINLINFLINRNYIEARENTVTIHRDLFIKTKLKLSNIKRITLSYTPFGRSYIMLTNGDKIRFSASNIDNSEIEKLKMITPHIN